MNCYAVISRMYRLVKKAKCKRVSIVYLLLCKEERKIRVYLLFFFLAERNTERTNQKLTRLVTYRK